MREPVYRSVAGNRATVTIPQTVYDRRALDNVSDLPLINSLNHLAFLCSTSSLIRDAMSKDGALERLVSILHECYIPVSDLPHFMTPQHTSLNPVQKVKRDRQLAYTSWKWTLAYQCLVLTGTRGSLSIREQVVKSGIVPIIATVLDNYMIYHKNFDYMNNTAIPFSFSELADVDSNLLKFTEEEVLRLNGKVGPEDPYYKEFLAMEKFKLLLGTSENQFGFDVENVAGLHLRPSFVTELDTDWQSLVQDELPGSALDNVVILPPRKFLLGRVIPELDDVTWAVQLLAFLTKNTAVKPVLQHATLVDSLSFRPILENAKSRLARSVELDITPLSLHADEEEEEEEDTAEPPENEATMALSPDITLIEKYFKEIQHLCLVKESEEEPCYGNNVDIFDVRLRKEETLHEKFIDLCEKKEDPRQLTDEDWERIFKDDSFNLFGLVERFTVKGATTEIVNYWSSVVMRNSCRKDEVTGLRQCANLSCGKWEEHPKQFPKCRRCKRTKYCSRLCQLKSWEYHRYWCQEATMTGTAETHGCEHSHSHAHPHSHSTAEATEVSDSETANQERDPDHDHEQMHSMDQDAQVATAIQPETATVLQQDQGLPPPPI